MIGAVLPHRAPSPALKFVATVILVAAVCVLLIEVAPTIIGGTQPKIVVDMRVSAATSTGIIVNDGTHGASNGTSPGVRYRYEFPIDGPISFLIFKPAQSAGATAEVFGMWAENNGVVVARYSPETLATWSTLGMTRVSADRRSLVFHTDTSDGNLVSAVDIPLGSSRRVGVAKRFDDPSALTAVATLCGLLVLMLWMPRWRSRCAGLGLVVFAMGASISLYSFVTDHFDPLPSTGGAVGAAAFIGYGSSGRQAASFVVLSGCGLLALGAAMVAARRRPGPCSVQELDVDVADGATRRGRLGLGAKLGAGLVGVVAFALLPDLPGGLTAARVTEFGPNWDANNFNAWTWLFTTGHTPMRDFWYPYGFQYLYESSLALGPLLRFAVQILVLAGFGRAVWMLAGRRPWPPIIVTGLLVVLYPAHLTRYPIAVLVALLYVARDRERDGFQLGDLFFGLAVMLALFSEPALVGYAAFGVVAVLAIDVLEQRGRTWCSWARRIAREASAAASGVALFVLVQILTGQISGTATLYRTLGEQAAYSAYPPLTIIERALDEPLSQAFVVLVAPALFVASGVFLRVRGTDPRLRQAGLFLLVVGAVAFAILQKRLIRGDVSMLMFTSLLGVGGAVSIACRPARGVARGVGAGLVLGLIVAVATVGPELSGAWESTRELPTRAWDDARLLLSHSSQIEAAEDARFSTAHFRQLTRENAVAHALRSRLAGATRGLFMLSSQPMLYVLLDQVPPWQVNTYNMSPLQEQRKVLDILSSNNVKFVVWDPAASTFDSVPEVVRIPAIYSYVMRHFVPQRMVAGYEILVPRHGKPFPLDYWRTKLGSTVDLGMIPAATPLPETSECRSRRPGCGTHLSIHTRRLLPEGTTIDVPVAVGGRDFAVRLRTSADRRDYVVRLDRVWFWKAAIDEGLSGGVTTTTTPDWDADLVYRRVGSDVLY